MWFPFIAQKFFFVSALVILWITSAYWHWRCLRSAAPGLPVNRRAFAQCWRAFADCDAWFDAIRRAFADSRRAFA